MDVLRIFSQEVMRGMGKKALPSVLKQNFKKDFFFMEKGRSYK